MKKKLLTLLLTLCTAFAVLGFVGCKDEKKSESPQSSLQTPLSSPSERPPETVHIHNYTTQVISPTCTEQGYTTYTCACGDSYVDDYVNATRHSYTEYISDGNATYDADGTKTATCDNGCGEEDRITDEGSKLKSGISFNTLTVKADDTVYGKVPNDTKTFSFLNEITAYGNASYVVSRDITGQTPIPSKTVPVVTGNNTFYVLAEVESNLTLYTVTIRVREIYTVSFNTLGGDEIASQQIEEDSYAVIPTQNTTKVHYTFQCWDYDFTKPVTDDITINAIYTPIEYAVTFKANDEIVATSTYTLENKNITEPTIPEKVHYTGAWESYALNLENITVNAIYTPIEYTVTFKVDDITVAAPTYTVENKRILSPAVPEKNGYDGTWESYTLNLQNTTVNAIYTLIPYTITYIDTVGAENSNVTGYTVESATITFLSLTDENAEYLFIGWLCDGEVITEIPQGSFGDKTLTAEWLYVAGKTVISNKEDLLNITLNGEYILLNDIDLNGIEWTPIGNESATFRGSFDGNGRIISNFIITKTQAYAGVFGYNSGTIENLGVTDFTVNISYSPYISVGGLVGYNTGTIHNCYTTGNVTANSLNANGGSSCAGGLTGVSNGTISDCYTTGNVTANSLNALDGSSHAGGLTGTSNGTISGCYATGNVTATSSSSMRGSSLAGGLVGKSNGTISGCYATGNVTATSSATNTRTTAHVSSSTGGGLVGTNGAGGIIENSYATSHITASSSGASSETNSNRSTNSSTGGGLVGANSSRTIIKDCYATGSVKVKSSGFSRYNYTSDSSDSFSTGGGLVGDNYWGTISGCYATGGVTASSTYSNQNYGYVGGLVGSNYSGTISDCYATGDVTVTLGLGYAGGLSGTNNDQGTITNCFRCIEKTVSASFINNSGTEKAMEELASVDFQTTTLGWSSDGWTFTEGTHPTLNWQN